MTLPTPAGEAPPPATTLCADLDAPHLPRTNLVWAARSPYHLHPSFAPPLGRLPAGLFFQGRAREGFGVWAERGESQATWEARSAQARVCFPRYTPAQRADLSEEQIDAMYNEFVIELRPQDPAIRVLVATVPRHDTLRGTLDEALARVPPHDGDPLSRFARDEGLLVPVVRLDHGDIHACFDQGGDPAPSSPVSYGLMSAPRRFVCRPPFLICVLSAATGAPDFALWVENPAVLVAR